MLRAKADRVSRALALLFAITVANAADIPRRIVSLSPDLTEILYGIGAFDRVVGVTSYETYPPEVAKLPHLGRLDTPNLEQLAALRPDLVILIRKQAPFLEDTLKSLGLRLLTVPNNNLQEVYEAMLTIGRATGNEAQAAKLAASTREGIDRVARKVSAAAKPGAAKPGVVLVIDRTPGTLRDLYGATGGSYLAELVEIAGGRMAMSPVATGYSKLRKEDLLAANPDIILDFVQGPPSRFAADPLEAWQEMPELKAVRTHHVFAVNEDYVPHATQRMVKTAELFAKKIHPEIP